MSIIKILISILIGILLITFLILFLAFIFSGTIIDFFKFPFDKNKEENKFYKILTFSLIEYPAFFWQKPSIKKLIAFPFLLIYKMFEK